MSSWEDRRASDLTGVVNSAVAARPDIFSTSYEGDEISLAPVYPPNLAKAFGLKAARSPGLPSCFYLGFPC